MFFEEGVWKTSKRRETFVRHLQYLVGLTRNRNPEQRSSSKTKLGGVQLTLPLRRKGLQFKLFEERFYELTHMKALPMVKNVFGLVFAYVFSNCLISRNLRDTSINTNTTYANLINYCESVEKKRICRSITQSSKFRC